MGPQRIDRQTRRRDRKGGRRSYNQTRSVPPEQSTHARDTWQHTYRYRTVTVPYPAHVIPKAKLRTDQCAHARRARSRMLTRAGARPKRGRDSQPDRAQAEDLALVAQPEARPQDELLAHAQAQSFGAQPAEEREPGHPSPHARQATASEQRAAAGISPGGCPVAASKATARRRKPNRETGPRNRETGPRTARGLRPYAALAMY